MLVARRAAIAATRKTARLDAAEHASNTLEAALAAGRTLAAAVPSQIQNIRTALDHLPAGHTLESLRALVD